MSKKAYDRIRAGLEDAAAYAEGERKGFRVHVPDAIDVRAIRTRTGLPQSRFARRIGVPLGTLRNWEQGRRTPEGPACVLLALLDRKPSLVAEMLGEDG
jgi:putative transcriptional regulator